MLQRERSRIGLSQARAAYFDMINEDAGQAGRQGPVTLGGSSEAVEALRRRLMAACNEVSRDRDPLAPIGILLNDVLREAYLASRAGVSPNEILHYCAQSGLAVTEQDLHEATAAYAEEMFSARFDGLMA